MIKGNMLRFCAAGIFGYSLLAEASTSETRNILLILNSPQPTCNVTVRSVLELGNITMGDSSHSPFPVSISCTGTVKSALLARNKTGVLQADKSSVSVSMGNVGAANGPFLWLQDGNSKVRLTGLSDDAFCTATNTSRTCYVTPWTRSVGDSGWGDGAVIMNFEIIYPA
ncbi:TPA: hypothetical protein ACGH1A_002616 [Salmonella enterica subsp. enterica serovar Hvittingfoss]|nr:hypothetical protein [Salmonella enterica]HAR9007099.1 hypothetical protein [Salmonella enterica]HAR9319155.1 hypothetical protein [Salmonella enterica]